MAYTIKSESYGPRKPKLVIEADSIDDVAELTEVAEGSTCKVGGDTYEYDSVNGWVIPGSGGGGGGLKIFTIQEIEDGEGESTYKANMPAGESGDCDLFLFIDYDGHKFPLTPELNARFSLLSANPASNPSIFLRYFEPDYDDATGLTYTVSFFSADLVFTEED